MKPLFTFGLICMLFSYFSIQAQTEETPCTGGSYDLVKPYLGTWKEYRVNDSTEVYTGTLTTQLDVHGCALSQVYIEQDSSFMYRTLGFVNPNSGLWEETYIFSTGSYSLFQWVVEDGSLYQKKIGGSSKADNIYRLEFQNNGANEYTVAWQHSYDGGRSWETKGHTRIERIQ